MAVKTVTIDDMDGSEGASTITFSLGSETYEIDLNEKNAEALREALAPFAQAGRRVARAGTSSKGQVKKPKNLPAGQREQLEAIREWARSQNMQVSDRGRIPAAIMEAFKESHQPAVSLPKRPVKKAQPAEPSIFSEAGT